MFVNAISYFSFKYLPEVHRVGLGNKIKAIITFLGKGKHPLEKMRAFIFIQTEFGMIQNMLKTPPHIK